MLFGKIKSIPLPQIAKMIEEKSGVVEIKTPKDEIYKLHFSNRQFLGAETENGWVEDIFTLRTLLLELTEKQESSFFFKETAVDSQNRALMLPIEQFIIASLHSLRTKYQKTIADFYPDPDTVFISTGADPSFLGSDLFAFWIEAQPFFSRGTTAKELLKYLFFPLEDILFYIYTLHLLEMIRLSDKKRVFQLPLVEHPLLNSIESKTPNDNLSPANLVEEKPSSSLAERTEIQAIQVYQSDQQQKKGLLKRLIYSFKNFFRKMYE